MNNRTVSEDRAAPIFAVMIALAGLGGALWPWRTDDLLAHPVFVGIRIHIVVMFCAVILLLGYRLASGPMFVPWKCAYGYSRSPEGRKPFRPDEEGGTRPPDAGKPSPLQPRPGGRLVAARSLPPGDSVFLYPKA